MNLGIRIQGIDLGEQLGKSNGFGKNDSFARKADLLRPCFFAGNVGAGGRIFPHPNEDESRGNASF